MILSTTFHDWLVAGAWVTLGLVVLTLIVFAVVCAGVMKEGEEVHTTRFMYDPNTKPTKEFKSISIKEDWEARRL